MKMWLVLVIIHVALSRHVESGQLDFLLFTLILRSSQTCGEALDIDTLSTTSEEVEQTRAIIIVAGWTA